MGQFKSLLRWTCPLLRNSLFETEVVHDSFWFSSYVVKGQSQAAPFFYIRCCPLHFFRPSLTKLGTVVAAEIALSLFLGHMVKVYQLVLNPCNVRSMSYVHFAWKLKLIHKLPLETKWPILIFSNIIKATGHLMCCSLNIFWTTAWSLPYLVQWVTSLIK